MRLLASVVVCAGICGLARAGDDAALPYKASDVEVRMRDGSVVRGEIRGAETLALKTAYGVLAFPVQEIVSVRPAERIAAKDVQEIEAIAKALDHDDFAQRSEAQRKLESFGSAAVEPLKVARQNASAEGRNRIDAIIKKILSSAVSKPLADDLIRTGDCRALGTLQAEALALSNKLGNLSIKFEDIESVRWLCKGQGKTLELAADAAVRGWIDTGVETTPGEKIVVLCSGAINLFNSGNVSGPAGTPNWSNCGAAFLVGSVIGRLGQDGKPFVIGGIKQWVPNTRERLYLKIYCTDDALQNQQPCTGQYKVRLGTGSWADEVLKQSPPEPSAPATHDDPANPFERLIKMGDVE